MASTALGQVDMSFLSLRVLRLWLLLLMLLIWLHSRVMALAGGREPVAGHLVEAVLVALFQELVQIVQ